MRYYGKIDVSERTDVNKTRSLKECDICYYWYFLDKWFKSCVRYIFASLFFKSKKRALVKQRKCFLSQKRDHRTNAKRSFKTM